MLIACPHQEPSTRRGTKPKCQRNQFDARGKCVAIAQRPGVDSRLAVFERSTGPADGDKPSSDRWSPTGLKGALQEDPIRLREVDNFADYSLAAFAPRTATD